MLPENLYQIKKWIVAGCIIFLQIFLLYFIPRSNFAFTTGIFLVRISSIRSWVTSIRGCGFGGKLIGEDIRDFNIFIFFFDVIYSDDTLQFYFHFLDFTKNRKIAKWLHQSTTAITTIITITTTSST